MMTFPIGGVAELDGAAYLYNLSLLAVIFAAVSALATIVRQTAGGKLPGFDVYLINTSVSFGFVIAFTAVLPPLILLFGLLRDSVWTIASGLGALLIAMNLASVVARRVRASRQPLPVIVLVGFCVHGVVVLSLATNALFPVVRGAALFCAALTLCLGNMMWVLVQRLSSPPGR